MSKLMEPLTFRGGAQARNRCVVAAMTNQTSNADGTCSEVEKRFLVRRAAGGFGIVTTCASHVTRDGQGWPGELGCFDDVHLPGLRDLADGIHGEGALGLVQIFHGGLRANPDVTGEAPLTASIGPHVPGLLPQTRAATTNDLARIIEHFAAAAARCEAAGWDGVEIHGAHGYLLTQFLSAHNDRTDGWGGDYSGRSRLTREVTRAVRAAVSKSFIVVVRLSLEDSGNARGLDLDEGVTLTGELAADGADAIHVSLADASLPSRKRPELFTTDAVRAAIPDDIPVFVAGKLWTKAAADVALLRGADAVALGRAAICNPDWPGLEPGPEPLGLRRPPMAEGDLLSLDVAPGFIEYLRRFPDFVA